MPCVGDPPPSNMRRYPPRAPSARGGFAVSRVGDADAQHEVIASAQSGFVVPHVGDPLPLLRCCIRPGLRWRRGGFLCGERPQRSRDVARIRCIPRASVPKPCIRASAPHAPVCRGSENTIDMQGFCPRGPFGAARLLRDAVSFDAVRLRSGLLRKRDAFLRRDRRTSGTASFRCAFQKLASGMRFVRLPGVPLRSSSRRVSRASGRRRRRFPPLRRLSGQCA